jgi:phenylacetate-CoA ligase
MLPRACAVPVPEGVPKRQLRIFRKVKKGVNAYAQVLAERGLQNFLPHSLEDWKQLPVLDKESYINRFSPEALSPHGRIAAAAHASSGSSGRATFWFRGPRHKRIGVAYYSRVIDEVMCIPRSERVLVLVCFGMGIWVAGTYTLLAFEQIGAQPDRKLTVISPGMEVDDIASIFLRLAPHFDCVLVVGYPAALDLLFDELARRRTHLPGKLHLVTSGDRIQEDWRDSQMTRLGIRAPSAIVNVYGSADGGLLAIETPLTIEIRRRMRASPALAKTILGDTLSSESALFQFDPDLFWFEEVSGELVFTADLDLPLIRYNIHDRGKVISHAEMMSRIRRLDIQERSVWRRPFLVVAGRTDVAVVLYGAKIYPEDLRFAIEDTRLRDRLSGSLFASSINSGSGQTFCLALELSDGAYFDDSQLPGTIATVIQERLIQSSSEYRNSCQKLGYSRNLPRVTLYRNGDPEFRNQSRLLISQGIPGGQTATALFWPAGGKPKIVFSGGAA